jgi:hypothetical protein
MKKGRRLPSAGVVLGLIALFVALGGTVYAAATINGKDIKKNSIPANRIKKKSLTSKQVNVAKLGKVPSAANADHASTANSAQTAGTANSATTAVTADTTKQITGFQFKADNGGSATVLNNFHGLSLIASCESGAEKGLTVKAASSSPEATISWSSTWQGSGGDTANNAYSQIGSTPATLYSPTGSTKTTNGPVNIGFAIGQIVYSQPTGSTQVSVNWSYNSNIAGNDCYWAGTVVANG